MLKEHKVYRVLLHLYPKAHRREYGEQMLQTFDDLLSEDPRAGHAVAVWLRVGRELPFTIVQEHINNWEGMKMSDFKPKRTVIIIAGAIVLLAVGLLVKSSVHQAAHAVSYKFATLQAVAKKPTCLQPKPGIEQHLGDRDVNGLGNAAATTITDALAGTNVDAYLKTFTGTEATGTAVYSGKYGDYNFTAHKDPKNIADYTGGWIITKYEACRS